MADVKTLRTDSVRVKLAPEMLERVEKLAADFGMPTATLCAFAVAAWVRGQEQQSSLARMAVLDASRRAGEQLEMSDEQMEKIFGPMVAAIAQQSALNQPNLPLDGEAAGKAA